MEKILMVLDGRVSERCLLEMLADALRESADVDFVRGLTDEHLLLAIRVDRPSILIDGRSGSAASDPAAWRRCAEHLFIVGISDGDVPRGKPWNLFATIRPGETAIRVFTPEGGEVVCETVKTFAAFMRRRSRVVWTRSVRSDDDRLTDTAAHDHAANLLAFAQAAQMFSDRNGNCSWRGSRPHTLVVTPRQAVKAACRPEDLVFAAHDPDGRLLTYAGTRKPSVDTSVQASLYAALPSVYGFLHVHPRAGIFLPDAVTDFPFPCGAQEEAAVVARTLRDTDHAQAPFIVELVHHGYLIGLEDGGADRLRHEWETVMNAYRSHLADVGKTGLDATLLVQPIMAHARIIGVIATHPREAWSTCFLLPSERGNGFGRRLLDPMAKRGFHVRAHVLCKVAEFYRANGWTIAAQDAESVTLAPPPSAGRKESESCVP